MGRQGSGEKSVHGYQTDGGGLGSQPRRFFGLKHGSQEDVSWDPVPFPTLDALVWTPVAAGLWRQHEISDGTYTIRDLLDVLEFLDVKAENERRYRAWREGQAAQ